MQDTETQISQLLTKLPPKLQVQYNLNCAYDCKHLLTDPRSLKALEVTELWLTGRATDEELRLAADAAADYATSAYAAYAAYAATYAAASAAYITYAASYYTAKALNLPLETYLVKLKEFISNTLTEVEIECYNIKV